jgi:hypothetical protein
MGVYKMSVNAFPTESGELPIRHYVADGAISDEDQVAIFDAGATAMTLSAATVDRQIHFNRTTAVDVSITSVVGEEFSVSTGGITPTISVSTDNTLVVNEPLTDGILWGTATGWIVTS